jgi:hypothetical protein
VGSALEVVKLGRGGWGVHNRKISRDNEGKNSNNGVYWSRVILEIL